MNNEPAINAEEVIEVFQKVLDTFDILVGTQLEMVKAHTACFNQVNKAKREMQAVVDDIQKFIDACEGD